MTEYYGSGNFCSRACANAREQTDEVRKKKHDTLSGTKAYSSETEVIYLKDGEEVPEGFYPGNFKTSYYATFEEFINQKRTSTEIRKTNNFFAREKQKENTRKKKLDKKVIVNGDELDITYGELEEYRKTHTVCDICGKPETCTTFKGNKKPNKLCIEHDHLTKKFRGLVCNRCNNRLA